MEGVDIVWVDEAQAITQNTLDILIPTIRKEKARIFFTMNRNLKMDPVYKMLSSHPKCLHININYTDNPFISQALMDEALICKRGRPEDYKHIWLGIPMSSTGNYLFNEDALDACLTRTFPHDPNKYQGKILGGDVARFGDNYSAGFLLKQCGPDHWQEELIERWKKYDTVYTSGKFMEMMNTHKPDYTIIDSDGLGAGVYDNLNNVRSDVIEFHGGEVGGLPLNKFKKPAFKNWRTYGYITLEKLVSDGKLRLKSQFVIDQLKEIRYKYDVKMNKYIIPKEQLIEQARLKGVKYESPDEADALMMARGGGQTYAAESNII